jgi:scyllo-inositol 2-dehydrogenase (NADP+)
MSYQGHQPTSVAVVGLGRSGWRNHVQTLLGLPDRFRLEAVVDPDPTRRAGAAEIPGVTAFPDVASLLGESTAELIVVASPSHLHADHAILAATAGRMVLCEKPMGVDLAEADAILAAAQLAPLFTVFCNYRFTPDFLAVRDVVARGVIGRPLAIRLAMTRFGRRQDWQTLARLGGGILRNSGWHLVDQALTLLDTGQTADAEPPVLSRLERVLSPGDAEDYAKVVLSVSGAMVDIEVSDVSPFPQPTWQVTGSRGSLVGDSRNLTWRYVLDGDLASLEVNAGAAPNREYRFDPCSYTEECWVLPGETVPPPQLFYRSLARTLSEGAPLTVTAECAHRVMKVIDSCLPTL